MNPLLAQVASRHTIEFVVLLLAVLPGPQSGNGGRFLEKERQVTEPSEATLGFRPFSLDSPYIEGFDMDEKSPKGDFLEASSAAIADPSAEPSGVLCRTLLHPSVHKHFTSFAKDGLGLKLAQKFDANFEEECKKAYTTEAWAHMWDNYTGNWTHDAVMPSDNFIFGSMGKWLNEERKKTARKATTWKAFRNNVSDNSTMEGLLRHISQHPTATTSLNRILDFGCGDGVELSRIAHGLGLGPQDTLCLDIVDYVAAEAKPHVTKMIVPADSEYGNSLQAHFESQNLVGSVSAVFSQVTFHHITQPKMRTAALKFIRESLAPGGFFLLAEWDNPLVPIDYSIYFDLAHYLPALFFSDPAPTEATLKPLDTCYLPLQGWIDLMGSNGLPFDLPRSRLPWSKGNDTIWLDPAATVEKASGRNFLAIFGKEQLQ